ncbi:hypothetical protein Q1M64_06990 (plasmid) [Sinorhizobium meliloti]|nr:hypothetical protein Q1M63_08415 [Sinorhizobium meliloti]WKL39212.1 hypothetical protein Q1M64_06990 [Sinorhizobium meliloti]
MVPTNNVSPQTAISRAAGTRASSSPPRRIEGHAEGERHDHD